MIIGITGGSASGKSSVAKMLGRQINAKVISLDDYFKDPNTFPVICGHPDYDRLESVDFTKAIKDIKQLKGHVIIEGIYVLAYKLIRELLNVSFFIDTDPEVLASRRIIREPNTNKDYINKHVQERYKELVLPSKRYASFVLDGRLSVIDLVAEVQQCLSSYTR